MKKSQSRLAKFARDYDELLEKYPEISVCSHPTEINPKAYHYVTDDNGNVITSFSMNLRSNNAQIL